MVEHCVGYVKDMGSILRRHINVDLGLQVILSKSICQVLKCEDTVVERSKLLVCPDLVGACNNLVHLSYHSLTRSLTLSCVTRYTNRHNVMGYHAGIDPRNVSLMGSMMSCIA